MSQPSSRPGQGCRPGRGALRTERDVIETLRGRCVTLADVYAACEAAGVVMRDQGTDVVHGRNDTRWRRRARGALQTLRRLGDASRVGEGTWLIKGTVDQPTTLILLASGDSSRMELVLATAVADGPVPRTALPDSG